VSGTTVCRSELAREPTPPMGAEHRSGFAAKAAPTGGHPDRVDTGVDCTGLAGPTLAPADVPNVVDPPSDLDFCAPGTDCP
jgi:hypothetical protein